EVARVPADRLARNGSGNPHEPPAQVVLPLQRFGDGQIIHCRIGGCGENQVDQHGADEDEGRRDLALFRIHRREVPTLSPYYGLIVANEPWCDKNNGLDFPNDMSKFVTTYSCTARRDRCRLEAEHFRRPGRKWATWRLIIPRLFPRRFRGRRPRPPPCGSRGLANTQEEQVVRMDVDTILVMVEIPRGSRNKYEYDPETGRIVLDRMLFSAVHYPADYGFIPETLAEDGDPLDALVLVGEATFPGCLIRAKPIGVFHMWDEKGPDDKILAVPVGDPQWSWASDLDDVPEHLLREITHFFQVYKDLEHKKTKVGGWDNAEFARKVIREARERWEQQKKA